MKRIIFKAVAGDVTIGEEGRLATIKELAQLSGVSCQDDFAEYSDFKSKLKIGHMSFEFENNTLYNITEFVLKVPLGPDEIEKLKEETQGQWSDGIGEGFEQQPCSSIGEEEVFISPWHREQVVETIIE